MKFRRITNLIKYGAILGLGGYCFESTYIAEVALKRSAFALYYEAKIFINYKINGFNDKTHDYCACQLAKLFRANKGPAIKLAQNLAQHHHVLPEPFIKHMEPFLQENPITPFPQIKKIFKQQFKKDILEVFDYIEETPIASGSVAQVHKAKLTGTYDYVALKVQHPELISQSKGDFLVVYYSCKLAEMAFPGVKVMWIYKDFYKNMNQEIDFETELNNIKKAKAIFKNEKRLIIPKVYKEYCSKRILAMSFEEGKSICNKKYQNENNINSNEISYLVNTLFNRQIFEYGFVHADPHHGNLFMRNELVNGRSRLKLIMLDFGLFMNLDKDLIRDYSNLWRGIFLQNYKIIEEASLNLGVKDPKIFTSMITGKAFDEVMDNDSKHDFDKRLKIRKVAQEKVRDFLNNHYKTILINLEYGREEIPLLLKIVDYLRSIDSKLEATKINSYSIMMENVYKSVFNEYKTKGIFNRLFLLVEYWRIRFSLFLIRAFLKKEKHQTSHEQINNRI